MQRPRGELPSYLEADEAAAVVELFQMTASEVGAATFPIAAFEDKLVAVASKVCQNVLQKMEEEDQGLLDLDCHIQYFWRLKVKLTSFLN